MAPVGEVILVELSEALAGPGLDMDAVGDGMDPVAGKKLLRDFRVPFGDTVDVAAEVQGQPRHIETFGAGDGLERADIDGAGQLALHQIVGKPVVAGLHRRVGGEDASLPRDLGIVHGVTRRLIAR